MPVVFHLMERKQAKGRTPKRVIRARAAARYPLVRENASVVRGGGPQMGTTIRSNRMPVFASRTIRSLRYSDYFQLTTTAGAVSTYVFAVNGLYDPNITGTGHQAMGFDQLMLFYNHYCVAKAKISVVASNASSVPCQIVIRQDASSTPITVIERILEIGANSYTHLDSAGSTNAQKELKLSVDVAKLQGVSRSALTADSTLRGDSSANPSELSYAHVQVFSAAGFTATVNFDILIEFEAYFMEPRDATQS